MAELVDALDLKSNLFEGPSSILGISNFNEFFFIYSFYNLL